MAGRHEADPPDRGTATDRIPDDDPASAHRDRLVDPGAVISDGTSVTVDLEAMPDKPDAVPSPARPDALVEHGLVGDGTELE